MSAETSPIAPLLEAFLKRKPRDDGPASGPDLLTVRLAAEGLESDQTRGGAHETIDSVLLVLVVQCYKNPLAALPLAHQIIGHDSRSEALGKIVEGCVEQLQTPARSNPKSFPYDVANVRDIIASIPNPKMQKDALARLETAVAGVAARRS